MSQLATEEADYRGTCYAAVIENRAKEVGLAVLEVTRLSLHITQFIEAGRSYTTTKLLLNAYQPTQLVVVGSTHHEVSGAAGVNQATATAWEQVPLARSAFDDTKGILAVQELTGWNKQTSSSGMQDDMPAAASRALHQSHYLGFGAAGALLSHVRHNLGIILAPRTLQVNFDGVQHYMSMDRDAVIGLEIMAQTRSQSALQKAVSCNINNSTAAVMQKQRSLQDRGLGASDPLHDSRDYHLQQTAPSRVVQDDTGRRQRGHGRRGSRWRAQHRVPIISHKTNSLFGFLNHTSTTVGARLLRTSLLQPLTDVNTLELRLDSLQELLESPHLTLELAALIETLPKNLDKVCSNLALQPQSATSTKDPSVRLGRLVSSVILLRDVLRCLPVMADSMAWVDSDLLKAIRANLGHADIQRLLQEIDAVLDDDAQASKTQFVNKVQQCFAVKAQVDSFLDISRASFTRLTESIHELAAKYRSSTGLTTLKVQYNSSKGFFLVVPEPNSGTGSTFRQAGGRSKPQDEAACVALPKTFLVLEKRGRNSISVTTHELNALNSRLRDAAADCMMLTMQVLDKLTTQLLQHMPLLQRMLDNLALLDLLVSFFHAVTGSDGDFCRPKFTTSGPLAVTKGRHPLLQAIKDPEFECKPNDTYISPSCTLHLLTGPNMSGKSTYLKQVALLVVMAQIGCYVPAAFMSLSPYESLHTRIGTCDSIESNASSFMVEMTDMAHLLARAGPRSLVLIDELGRATSTSDGVALSWSMSEYLLSLGAHVLLATHFKQLEDLSALYPSCKLWCMQVSVHDSDIHYSWTIAAAAQAAASGAAAPDAGCHYGVLLAQMAGLPAGITSRALQVAEKLELKQKQRQDMQQQEQGGKAKNLKQVYSLVHKLGCVARQAGANSRLEVQQTEGTASAEPVQFSTSSMQSLLPLLKVLKQEAEALLLAAARQTAD